MFMNGSIKAEDFLDDRYEMIVNNDWNWFNAGSFFIKNSEWSRNFLQMVVNVTKPDPDYFLEQAAIMVR
jgi:galactosyl transferase GMA12/MNN10 family